MRPETVARGNRDRVFIPNKQVWIGPESRRRRFVDHVHGERLAARALESEFQIGGHEDRDVPVQVGSLTAGGHRTLSGFNKIDFLLALQPRMLGRRAWGPRGMN